MNEELRNQVHQEVQRVLDRRTHDMPCIVDSYDPTTFTVKVKLQPSGNLTGWVQIEQSATGSGFGDQAAPNVGDPGWLKFHGGDIRAAVFAGTVSNDLNPAVPIQAGERLIKAKWGQSIYLKEDGSLTLADGAGGSIMLKNGVVTIADKAGSSLLLDGEGRAKLTATTIELNGNIVGASDGPVTSNVTIETSGDFVAGTISLKSHVHNGVQTGGGDTGAPVP